MTEYEVLLNQHAHYKRALRLIVEHTGRVCDDFELCTHTSCNDSCAAWMYANAALRGEELPRM